MKTRNMAPPGAHAHQAVPRVQDVRSGVTETIERQNRTMRELSRRAFPEPDVLADDMLAPIKQTRAQRRRQAAATEAAALRRARAERAGAAVLSAPRSRQAPGEVA